MSLQNKVALVTGAASGIGRECALTLARKGATVVIADLNQEAADAVATQIKQAGGKAMGVVMDVTSEEAVNAGTDLAAKTFGGIDMTVRRNAFGRQVDSFESDLTFNSKSMHAVFIRAPWVEQVGPDVEILASASDHPVAVRQGKLLATSFHPELTADLSVHSYFFDEMCK